MENENKKLTPMRFLSDKMDMPWGTVEYKLADLGFVDSLASEGWLKGNNLSDIMQTYLERVVGETSFNWYGTQFPVLVKKLTVKGRTSLHVTADDETAEQRYDAFGKTALWYVESAGPDATLYLGFKEDITAERFYKACHENNVEPLLHKVKPKAGETFLITPGMVHAAKDVTLVEIAEASELWFRLYDWGADDRENHLEEAFDLIDFQRYRVSRSKEEEGAIAITPQFTVNKIGLTQPLKSTRDEDDTFLLYYCTRGKADIQAAQVNYKMKEGDLVLIPAETNEFFLLPETSDAELLEVRMDPRPENDIVSEPVDEQ
ncbi:MAG: class I mannose-6-phosphate isomerase, partial [Bacteroidales bacterium]|jgi:mannose-6-phosphate isomerase|nr:class I mannose-6-phosphate isomerase [Bacteroidales bacterium]